MHILIVSISNLKLPVFGLFSRFVHTLIIKISSSEEPANSTSIHRVRNGGKLVILFHPSPKNITKRCRSPIWKPAEGRWKFQNDAELARQNFTGACADEMSPPLSLPPLPPPARWWTTLNYRAQIWGANKLTGKMVLILQQEEWISLLVMVLFSAMFSYFILDSFELEEMVCLTKYGATFS